MKKLLSLVLAVSLLLNLALIWLIFGGNEPPAAAVATAPSIPPPTRPPALEVSIWPGLQTNDLPELIARLRAAGFPPHLVRAIVAAQLDENFAARRRVLDAGTENLPFWKTRPPDPRINLAFLQLEREKQTTLRQLFGPDSETDDPLSQIIQNRRVQGLPPDKVESIRSLLREFDEQRDDIYASGTYSMVREKLPALEKAQRDAIVRLLTPQELAEYDLRTSNTASSLRNELAAFNPTEAEFRAIFQLRQPFDEQFNSNFAATPPSSEQMQRREEAQKLLNEQIKAALAPDRAAEYERAIDDNYRQTSQLVARLELPPETAGQVYAVEKDVQQRLLAYYGNETLSPEQRSQQLAALRQEVEAKLTPMLGAQGFEAYRQYGGSWMQSLTPPVARQP